MPDDATFSAASPTLRGSLSSDWRRVPAISAASVIAKVARDRQMADLDAQFPGYGLAAHKGYGTPFHREALQRLGPTPIHRTSFAPVARAAGAGQRTLDLG